MYFALVLVTILVLSARAAAQPDVAVLTPAELAEVLTISEATLRQWRWMGKGPHWIRVGRHIRYRRTDVDAWLRAGADTPGRAAI